MSKFLAMLKDSYREAVDGWIFLVMLVLSGLLVLVVFGLSFAPLPADEAVPRMLTGQEMLTVQADRGRASRVAVFLYTPRVADVRVVSPREPVWESELAFAVTYQSAGVGGGVEIDGDPKDPKNVKGARPIEGQGLFADAFKEAVRYWAGKPGDKSKPEFSKELAEEYVAAQMRDIGRFRVKAVEYQPAGGGFLPKIGPSAHTFLVTADGADRLGWAHRPGLLFGAAPVRFLDGPLGGLVYLIENTLVNGFGAWVVVLAGVVVTAGFVPNMLRKGAIDLLLTKPLSRPLILIYKYLGGLLFVFLLTAVAVGGVWVAIGVRSGVWAPGLLYSILGTTFYFAVLYACSTLVGVLTRNAIVSIVVTITFWFVVWLIGFILSALTVVNKLDVQPDRPARAGEAAAADPAPAAAVPQGVIDTFTVLNAVTPRTSDLDTLIGRLIADDLQSPAELRRERQNRPPLNWGEVLGIAAAYIAGFLGLATLRFVTRSY